jgi:hypothetical protein
MEKIGEMAIDDKGPPLEDSRVAGVNSKLE